MAACMPLSPQNRKSKFTGSLRSCPAIAFLLIFNSCSDPFVEASKSAQTKRINEFIFTLTPLTVESLLRINYGSDAEKFSQQQRDSVLSEYNDYTCYIFDVSIDGFSGKIDEYHQPENVEESDESTESPTHAKLISTDGAVLPCEITFDERLNDISHRNRFVFGFRTAGKQAKTFEYVNPRLTCGPIKFDLKPSL